MRDGSVTDRRACASCGRALPLADPRRRYCSAACRSRAHRRRQAAALPEAALARRPMAETVYECPACEGRLLGERRCSDCNLFCRSLGPGGPCPCCDEPVALGDLVAGLGARSEPVPRQPHSGGLAGGSPASEGRRETIERSIPM